MISSDARINKEAGEEMTERKPVEYRCNEEDLSALYGYAQGIADGESPKKMLDLFRSELSVIRGRLVITPPEGARPESEAEYRHVINLDKFLKLFDQYVHETFCISENEKKETVEETFDIIVRCTQSKTEHNAAIRKEELETILNKLFYLRYPVLKFAFAVETNLRKNDYKGGWEDCQLEYLLDKLYEEVEEVDEALDTPGFGAYEYESADVGAVAMMIYDKGNITFSDELYADLQFIESLRGSKQVQKP